MFQILGESTRPSLRLVRSQEEAFGVLSVQGLQFNPVKPGMTTPAGTIPGISPGSNGLLPLSPNRANLRLWQKSTFAPFAT